MEAYSPHIALLKVSNASPHHIPRHLPPKNDGFHSMRDRETRQVASPAPAHLLLSEITLESCSLQFKKTPASLNSMSTCVLTHKSMHGCSDVPGVATRRQGSTTITPSLPICACGVPITDC